MRLTNPGSATALVAALVLLLGACGGSNKASASPSNCATRAGAANATYTGSARATGSVIDVEARDFDFHPTCVTDVPSGTVTLVVHNSGAQLHNVQIPSQHVDRDIQPGATVTISVTMHDAPVVFVCKYHHGLGMAGALIPTPTQPQGG